MSSDRRDKHWRLPVNLVADFKKTASIFGLNETQAAEAALREWIHANRDEAQKRLEAFAEHGVTIKDVESVTVNVTVFHKAEILLAKDELTRLLDVIERIQDPDSKKETQLELARALKVIQPVYVKTRDPELGRLLAEAEAKLG